MKVSVVFSFIFLLFKNIILAKSLSYNIKSDRARNVEGKNSERKIEESPQFINYEYQQQPEEADVYDQKGLYYDVADPSGLQKRAYVPNLHQRRSGIIYGDGIPIGLLQPYQESYKFTPIKEETVYSVEANPGQVEDEPFVNFLYPLARESRSGNPKSLPFKWKDIKSVDPEQQSLKQISSWKSRDREDNYQSMLINFKIQDKLKSRNSALKFGDASSLQTSINKKHKRKINDEQFDKLQNTVLKMQSKENQEHMEEDLRGLLNDVGLIEDDMDEREETMERRKRRREVAQDEDDGSKRSDQMKLGNAVDTKTSDRKKREEKAETAVKEIIVDISKPLKDQQNGMRASEDESPEKNRHKPNVIPNKREQPAMSDAAFTANGNSIVDKMQSSGDRSIPDTQAKETFDEYEKRVATEIRNKIKELKEEVKRELNALDQARSSDNNEDDDDQDPMGEPQRKKRNTQNTLLDEETKEIDPNQNIDGDLTPHVRRRRTTAARKLIKSNNIEDSRMITEKLEEASSTEAVRLSPHELLVEERKKDEQVKSDEKFLKKLIGSVQFLEIRKAIDKLNDFLNRNNNYQSQKLPITKNSNVERDPIKDAANPEQVRVSNVGSTNREWLPSDHSRDVIKQQLETLISRNAVKPTEVNTHYKHVDFIGKSTVETVDSEDSEMVVGDDVGISKVNLDKQTRIDLDVTQPQKQTAIVDDSFLRISDPNGVRIDHSNKNKYIQQQVGTSNTYHKNSKEPSNEPNRNAEDPQTKQGSEFKQPYDDRTTESNDELFNNNSEREHTPKKSRRIASDEPEDETKDINVPNQARIEIELAKFANLLHAVQNQKQDQRAPYLESEMMKNNEEISKHKTSTNDVRIREIKTIEDIPNGQRSKHRFEQDPWTEVTSTEKCYNRFSTDKEREEIARPRVESRGLNSNDERVEITSSTYTPIFNRSKLDNLTVNGLKSGIHKKYFKRNRKKRRRKKKKRHRVKRVKPTTNAGNAEISATQKKSIDLDGEIHEKRSRIIRKILDGVNYNSSSSRNELHKQSLSMSSAGRHVPEKDVTNMKVGSNEESDDVQHSENMTHNSSILVQGQNHNIVVHTIKNAGSTAGKTLSSSEKAQFRQNKRPYDTFSMFVPVSKGNKPIGRAPINLRHFGKGVDKKKNIGRLGLNLKRKFSNGLAKTLLVNRIPKLRRRKRDLQAGADQVAEVMPLAYGRATRANALFPFSHTAFLPNTDEEFDEDANEFGENGLVDVSNVAKREITDSVDMDDRLNSFLNRQSRSYRNPYMYNANFNEDDDAENVFDMEDQVPDDDFDRDKRSFQEGGMPESVEKRLKDLRNRSMIPAVRLKRYGSRRYYREPQQQQRLLSEMSDVDLFGPLPQSYQGGLARYKRVKRSRRSIA